MLVAPLNTLQRFGTSEIGSQAPTSLLQTTLKPYNAPCPAHGPVHQPQTSDHVRRLQSVPQSAQHDVVPVLILKLMSGMVTGPISTTSSFDSIDLVTGSKD